MARTKPPFGPFGPSDRLIGSLQFRRDGLTYTVYNRHANGAWYLVGALDVLDRHPYVEPDNALVERAKALAARRHEVLEGV